MISISETGRMETGGGRQGSRREAASSVWARLKESLAVGALVLAAGCGGAAVPAQQTTPAAPTPTAAAARPGEAQATRTGRVAASVPSGSIALERYARTTDDGGVEAAATFTATQTMVTTPDGRQMPLAEYEAANGRQTLTYYWYMFQNIQPGTGMLLLNPQYRDSSQPRYTGMIMRGVTTTDGQSGDFVVRVRRVEMPSRSLEWAPVVERDGRVLPENVVIQLQAGSLAPINDSVLMRNIEGASIIRAGPMVTVVEYGPTTPVVSIRVSDKMAVALPAQNASESQMAPRVSDKTAFELPAQPATASQIAPRK